MNLVVRPRSPALAPFVELLGYSEGSFEHARERSLPSGHMQLLVNLHADRLSTFHGDGLDVERRIGGSGLHGAQAGPIGIDTADQRAIVWVCFRAGGALPFFPAPPAAMAGELVGLDDLWGPAGVVLRERLLAAPSPAAALRTMEDVLLARAVRPLERDPAVGFAVAALDRGSAVADVIDRLGLTSKGFVSRFARTVGLRPKRYARVRRFQRLLGMAAAGRPGTGPRAEPGDRDWARLAAECGYFDQSHLINEFRALSGMSPTAYRARPDGRNHVPLD